MLRDTEGFGDDASENLSLDVTRTHCVHEQVAFGEPEVVSAGELAKVSEAQRGSGNAVPKMCNRLTRARDGEAGSIEWDRQDVYVGVISAASFRRLDAIRSVLEQQHGPTLQHRVVEQPVDRVS